MKVLVFGTFDGLHEGHISFLRQAKTFGDYLVAVVGRDSSVRKTKGKAPRRAEQERKMAVENSGLANEVQLGIESHNPNEDSYDIIKEINPDVICLGYDQAHFKEKLQKELERINVKARVEILTPYKPEIYKSSLLNK